MAIQGISPPRVIRPLVLGFALAATAIALRADFSGFYDVGAPGAYDLVNNSTTAFGHWQASATFSGPGSSGNLDTRSAPASLTLVATGGSVTDRVAGAATTLLTFASFATARFVFLGVAFSRRLRRD